MFGGAAARRAAAVCALVALAWPAWSSFGPARASAPWPAPVDLSAARDSASAPQVAVDARGNAVRGALRPAGEGWQQARTISPHQPVAEATGAEAALTIDGRGNAIAVWGREITGVGTYDNVVQAAVHGPP